MHLLLTLFVSGLTLALILLRPRGMHEAWATTIGGALMLVCGLETPRQAGQTVAQGGDVLLFLLALLLLSDLLRASGFFEWAAVHAARAAGGDGRALYRNVFVLGALITAFLSLDTTAVILTPLVLSFVQRLRLPSRPFLLACAFVANTGSLLLPVSNLTNLLFVSAFHLGFGAFALRMALPQVVAVVVNYALFRWLFARDLPERFALDDLPEPREVLPDVPFFRGAVVVLGCVLIGYFVGSLSDVPPYAVALAGCAALFGWGLWRRQVGLGIGGNPLAAFPVCDWPVRGGAGRRKSRTGGVGGARSYGSGTAAAGANSGDSVRGGTGLQCRQQHPDGAAGNLRTASRARRRACTLWCAAGVQSWPQPHPGGVTGDHAGHFQRSAGRGRHRGARILCGGPAGDPLAAPHSRTGTLAGITDVPIKKTGNVPQDT